MFFLLCFFGGVGAWVPGGAGQMGTWGTCQSRRPSSVHATRGPLLRRPFCFCRVLVLDVFTSKMCLYEPSPRPTAQKVPKSGNQPWPWPTVFLSFPVPGWCKTRQLYLGKLKISLKILSLCTRKNWDQQDTGCLLMSGSSSYLTEATKSVRS